MAVYDTVISFKFSDLPLELQDSVFEVYQRSGFSLSDAFLNVLTVWVSIVNHNMEV